MTTLGYGDKVAFCPDPTLSLDLREWIRDADIPPRKRDKKVLGVSVMAHFADAIAEALLADPALRERYDVWFYPYSRQYNHIESVLRIRQKYGAVFHYVDDYQDPLDTVALMATFHASINDTYHGTIVALLLGIPFLVIDREDPIRSRHRNLLRLFSMENHIVASQPHGLTNVWGQLLLGDVLVERWRAALQQLAESRPADLTAARALIDAHFDRIARGIIDRPALDTGIR